MKKAQSEIKHAKQRFLTEDLMKTAPAYVRTMEPICRDKELLLPSAYGGGHRI